MKLLALSVGLVLVCSGQAQSQYSNGGDRLTVMLRLMKRYYHALEYVDEVRAGAKLVVAEGQWHYEPRRGLQFMPPVDMPSPDSWQSDGGEWEQRRVESKKGYRKVEGTVSLGTVTGVNVGPPGEAAYDYFGIKKTGYYDFEGGVHVWGNHANWFAHVSLNGTTTNLNWPTGGLAPGTDVFMRIYVPVPNRVVFFISYSPPSSLAPVTQAWEFDANGLDPNGKDQWVRRNTSLYVETTGSSSNNVWSGVSLGDLSALHLWTSGYTEPPKIATPGATYTTHVCDHNETISLSRN